MELRDFLRTVVTAQGEGWFVLSLARKAGGGWADQWYKWPDDLENIVAQALDKRDEYNVYFSTYLFSAQRRVKANVLPSRTIQVDLDEADVATLPIKPSILIESSPGHHQGFWILSDELPLDTHEVLSRKLSYSIDKADHSGWPIGHTARLPETINHKYPDGPKQVTILNNSTAPLDSIQFELLPDVDKPSLIEDEKWLDADKPIPDIGVHEFLNTLVQQKKLSPKIVSQYVAAQKDRSSALWALELALFRADISRDTVYHIASKSANNKFADLRYHGERDLAKDVLRAEGVARRKFPDPRSAIREMRLLEGPKFVGNQQIANVVIEILKSEGEFVHTIGNALWYIRRETGRPIYISRASDGLNSLLDIQFGLNPSESEHNYVKCAIIDYVVSLDDKTNVGILSHFNTSTNEVLLHTGGRDILRIAKDNISKVTNGADDILFNWNHMSEPFIPDYAPLLDQDGGPCSWCDVVFRNAFDTILNLSPEESRAVLHVWTHFILLRKGVYTRPILAFFGAPGGGKSTIMRRIYRVLYGRRRELMMPTSAADFDLGTTKEPFMVLDQADNWERWLPDRLAAAINDTDVDHRKLFTDSDHVTWRRQAIIGITAHNPKFIREDITDRLILLTFKRLPKFVDEATIHSSIIANRNKIWGAIIKELQAILASPLPSAIEAPQFRIQDFAVLGLRIARALDIEAPFRSALESIRIEQRLYSLEEDSMIVNSLKTMLVKDKEKANGVIERPVGVLWHTLLGYSGNVQSFERLYHNASALGKKLLVMQEPLSELFVVRNRFDAAHGTRLWSFEPKNGTLELMQRHTPETKAETS